MRTPVIRDRAAQNLMSQMRSPSRVQVSSIVYWPAQSLLHYARNRATLLYIYAKNSFARQWRTSATPAPTVQMDADRISSPRSPGHSTARPPRSICPPASPIALHTPSHTTYGHLYRSARPAPQYKLASPVDAALWHGVALFSICHKRRAV